MKLAKDIVLGKIDSEEGCFILGEDGIAGRIDDDKTVRLASEVVVKIQKPLKIEIAQLKREICQLKADLLNYINN